MKKNLKDLKQDPVNAREHTDRNLDMIEDSIREDGTGRSIFIDENDQIIAGNGTVIAAAKAGVTKVEIVDVEGDTLVAVRRRGLTPEQKRRMALRDNRASELAEWDTAVLRAMQQSGDLDGIFTNEELAGMLDEPAEPQAIQPKVIERPKEVAWVLCAIPLDSWPKNQAHIEALQNASVFTTMVTRPKE